MYCSLIGGGEYEFGALLDLAHSIFDVPPVRHIEVVGEWYVVLFNIYIYIYLSGLINYAGINSDTVTLTSSHESRPECIDLLFIMLLLHLLLLLVLLFLVLMFLVDIIGIIGPNDGGEHIIKEFILY
jgi:hypothetical protein